MPFNPKYSRVISKTKNNVLPEYSTRIKIKKLTVIQYYNPQPLLYFTHCPYISIKGGKTDSDRIQGHNIKLYFFRCMI